MKEICTLFFSLFILTCYAQDDNFDFTGYWETTNGKMEILQILDSVQGYYAFNEGFLEGNVSGNSLHASFREYNGNPDPLLSYDYGWFDLSLSGNRMSFSGTKTYSVLPDDHIDFTGTRLRGTIAGGVYDFYDTDIPIPDVEVLLKSSDGTKTYQTAVTDEDGLYAFENIYTGLYIVETNKKFYESWIRHEYTDGILLLSENIDNCNFIIYPNAFLTLTAEKRSLLYDEEVTIRLEIKNEDSAYIQGSHEVQFQEIYENLGYFENDGIAVTKDGIAEIVYTAPSEEEAGEWEHLKIKATLLEYDYEDNYKILNLDLGTGMPVWAEPRHSKYVIDVSKKAIIPSHPNYPALIYGKSEDANGDPIEGRKIEFEIENDSKGRLRNSKTEETGQKVSAYTNEEGIASVYYIYNEYHRLKEKFIQEIRVSDTEKGSYGIVTVEVGLGLRIYKTERYRSSGGIISPYTPVDLVQYVSSDFHPDLNVYWYSLNAQEEVWDEMDIELGLWYELEWVNKPDSWWSIPDDETYIGRCRFDELDGNTILKALDEPSDIIGDSHYLPQFIPHSNGDHTYFSLAWLTNTKISFQTTNIPVAFNTRLFTTKVEVDSKITDFLCSFSPTSKQQIIMIFVAKKLAGIYGNTLDFVEVACNIASGKNFDAFISLWSAVGGTYIDYNVEKLKAIDANYFNKWTWDDLKQLLKQAHNKDRLDYIKLFTDIYWADNTYSEITWHKSAGLKSVKLEDQRSMEDFISMFLAPDIGISAGAGLSGTRNLTLFNGKNADASIDQEKPTEIDLPYGEINDFMYAENEWGYVCSFSEESQVDFNFKSGDDTYLTIYNDGEKCYKLFDVSDYPDANCKIILDNSDNEILEIDANKDGYYEQTAEAEIIGSTGNTGPGNVTISLDWVTSIGSSGTDYDDDICFDSNGNSYLLARFAESPVYTEGQTITYDFSESFFSLLVKYSPEGEMEWYKKLRNCYPYGGVCVDNDDNIYAGIYVRDNSFYVGSQEIDFQGAVIIKYDSNGENGMASNIIRGENVKVYHLETDSYSNFYVCGRFEGNAYAGDEVFYSNTDNDDWYIAKFNSSRELQWFKTRQSSGEDYINDLVITDQGILFDGNYTNSIRYGSQTYYKEKEHEQFLGFMDFEGNEEWLHFIKSDNSHVIVSTLEVGDKYIAFLRSPVSGDMYINNQLLPESEEYDMMYLIMDLNGNPETLVMSKQEGNQYIRGVCPGNEGDIILGGAFTGEIWGNESSESDGIYDGFLARMDSSFERKYTEILSIPGHNSIEQAEYDSNNNRILTVGDFSNDFTLNGKSVQNKGDDDLIIVAFKESVYTSIKRDELPNLIKDKIRIYPNPTRGKLMIEIPESVEGPSEISIWDIKGTKLGVIKYRDEGLSQKKYSYNTDHLKNGIYLIVYDFPGNRIVKKVIVSR